MIRELITVTRALEDIAGARVRSRQYECWLHPDPSPSGRVSRDDKRFKCFQCNAAGTIFDVAMLALNLSFIEAKKYLYQLYGLNPPDTGSPEARRQFAKLKEERGLEAAFKAKTDIVYDELAAMHRALFKYDGGALEHYTIALSELLDELMSKDPERRVKAVKFAQKWWLV